MINVQLSAWESEPTSVERADAFWRAALDAGIRCPECRGVGRMRPIRYIMERLARDPDAFDRSPTPGERLPDCLSCQRTGRTRDPRQVVEWWLSSVCAECGRAPEEHDEQGCSGILRRRLPAMRMLDAWAGCMGHAAPAATHGCAACELLLVGAGLLAEADAGEPASDDDASNWEARDDALDRQVAAALGCLLTSIARIPAPCSRCGGRGGELARVGAAAVDPERCDHCRGSGREPCPSRHQWPPGEWRLNREQDRHQFTLPSGRVYAEVSAWVPWPHGDWFDALPRILCPLCCGTGALPLFVPGICLTCGKPSEAHHTDVSGPPDPGEPQGYALFCTVAADEYVERPGPLSSPWPRGEVREVLPAGVQPDPKARALVAAAAEATELFSDDELEAAAERGRRGG